MKKLAVVLDGFALLRESRRRRDPDPVACAHIAALAGADLVTLHLRGDRRHIQNRDLEMLQRGAPVPVNLRISTQTEMTSVAREQKPDCTTLVPERQDEVALAAGLDAVLHQEPIRRATVQLREAGLAVHVVVEPDIEQLKAVARAGAVGVELYTGRYARAGDDRMREQELARLQEAARAGNMLELRVAAGGGLDFGNIEPVAEIEGIETYHVGHGLVARAALVGLDTAVRDLKLALNGGAGKRT